MNIMMTEQKRRYGFLSPKHIDHAGKIGRLRFSKRALSFLTLMFALAVGSGCGGNGRTSLSPPAPEPPPTVSNGHFRALKPRSVTSSFAKAAFDGASTPTTTMTYARVQPTATLLADGRVLVTGGSADPIGTYTAEVFDPTTEMFSLLDSRMSWGRMNHCAVTLPDNTVLLIGGPPMVRLDSSDWLPPTVDVFNPATNSFSAYTLNGPLPDSSNGGPTNCMRLSANRVLIFSSQSGPMVLNTDTWQTHALEGPAGSLPLFSSMTQTPDGRIWIVGGRFGWEPPVETTANIWWFDPETESVSIVGHLLHAREATGILAFSDNSVEVYGGVYSEDANGGIASQTLSSVEHIDPSGVASMIGELPMPKAFFTSVMLQNSKSLHVGGSDINGSSNDTQYVFDETTHVSGATGNLIERREAYGIAPLTTGRVLIVGGMNGQDSSNTAEIFEPDASLYILLPKTTVAPGEAVQLSTESSTHGTVRWAARYGNVSETGKYTAPRENPIGPASPITSLQDEVTAILSTGSRAIAPITVQFSASVSQ